MPRASRRLLVLVAIAASSWVVYGCSAGSPEAATVGAAGTSGTIEPGFMDVQFTTSSVILSNKAGMPIKDLVVVLKPARGMTYETRVDRMEGTQKKEIPFADFKSGGGIPWRSGKPKEVIATATDVAGGKRNMTMPVS